MRVTVSDHAVLRLLERRLGVDTDIVRNFIAKEMAVAVKAGACSATIDGIAFQVRNGVVTTCWPTGKADNLGRNRNPKERR